MRGVQIFSGRSHPALTDAICQRLGTAPGDCELGNFANGETSVQINASIRNEDVFIVQSGSRHINDSVMELLIMVAACKGGSAKSITAVMPYFPYARSSKKKSHRGPITAKMLANLMTVAGVTHVITVDLHASQMQGFFQQGVDNLHCENLVARWIRANVRNWQDAVVVSKNVGGSKRVTSLADALKINFAIIATDRRRNTSRISTNLMDSVIFFDAIEPTRLRTDSPIESRQISPVIEVPAEIDDVQGKRSQTSKSIPDSQTKQSFNSNSAKPSRPRNVTISSSPLIATARNDSSSPDVSAEQDDENELLRVVTAPSARRPSEYESAEGCHDARARDVVVARIVRGHVVDDDHPSPALSGLSGFGFPNDPDESEAIEDSAMDPMMSSFMSNASSLHGHSLGGTFDAAASSDEDDELMENLTIEHTATLIGSVRDKTAIIMDDIMDRSGSWIAAAETCRKRGGAKTIYCVGIHALLGENALEEMEACDCIDHIVITNTFPISLQRLRASRKLIVIDLSNLLSEAIRRNHHGESISALFMQD